MHFIIFQDSLEFEEANDSDTWPVDVYEIASDVEIGATESANNTNSAVEGAHHYSDNSSGPDIEFIPNDTMGCASKEKATTTEEEVALAIIVEGAHQYVDNSNGAVVEFNADTKQHDDEKTRATEIEDPELTLAIIAYTPGKDNMVITEIYIEIL